MSIAYVSLYAIAAAVVATVGYDFYLLGVSSPGIIALLAVLGVLGLAFCRPRITWIYACLLLTYGAVMVGHGYLTFADAKEFAAMNSNLAMYILTSSLMFITYEAGKPSLAEKNTEDEAAI